MYYYRIKGETRVRTTLDKNVKGDPYISFDPKYYDQWSHKDDETDAIDKWWIAEPIKN